VAKTAEWVAAEVARVTVHRDDIDADRLARSLTLLSRGVDEWNRFRAVDPDFVPYLPAVDVRACARELGPLDEIDLRHADLRGADLDATSLRDADLSEARLERASFEEASLVGATFSGATMQRASLAEAVADFAVFHDAHLEGASFAETDLGHADFQGAHLGTADLSYADASDSFWMGASLAEARLHGTKLPNADMSGADLSYAMLIDTDLSGADLTGASVYGASVWGVELDGARQQGLVITSGREPAVFVDDLEVAQFLYTMLNHAKLRKAITAVSARGVLLLGRFRDGGLELLQAVADRLRELGYLPILFDFDRPENRSYTETIMVLVGLSRFVVADLSGPSVPQELYATVPHFKIPFVPILEAARTPHGMAPDLLEYPWVVKPVVKFGTAADLIEQLDANVIGPAEKLGEARRQTLSELFG
jgi:uncharacterized protein YjbI with pentapeptide repeats